MWTFLIPTDLFSDTDSLQSKKKNNNNKPQLGDVQMLRSVITFFFWWPSEHIKQTI